LYEMAACFAVSLSKTSARRLAHSCSSVILEFVLL
jgi:hypothetical protein